ncbi:lipopolysaccharide biosynthesis protein [Cupriavidus basilensis OR16]|uniref:Lipopolysaccharide biosynthesis protein n=1 Tax=Cupriavidus basilensis OR16 TaxID=1127483 RepID=H1SBG9_9BURK|nr:oligosaccharide flippase family protein [Cupriavidus basilensis]EHP40137.1 lipopolysaccharide biosynthesis protein [Cupriavidus basilensis OR16]
MQRRVASNLIWMLVERGLQVVAGIGIVAMLARGLGPEGFAHFQYAQALVYIASSIALICGSEVVVPRLVADTSPLAQHRLISHAFRLRLAAGGTGYLLMCAFLSITAQPIEFWLPSLILGVAVMLREPFGIVTAWMQAHTQTRPNTLFNLASLSVKAACVALLFMLGTRNVPVYALAFLLESVLMAALLASFYLNRAQHAPTSHDPALTRELFGNGLFFWASFMLMMASRRIDQLLLKPQVSLGDLGAYAASVQILDNFVVLATILAAGVAPIYVYAQPTLAQARRNILKIAVAMTAVGTTGGILIALSAHWIVHLLYGAAFAKAANLLQFTALASALVFADVGLTLLPIYLRRPRLVAIKWGLVFGVTIAIDLIAIPRIGVYGAIVGYATANLLSVLFGLALWIHNAHTTLAIQETRA